MAQTSRLIQSNRSFFRAEDLPLLLLPYLLVYLGAWHFQIDIQRVRHWFEILNFATLGIFLIILWSCQSHLSRPSNVIFWTGLLLFFYLPGAYLEFPSDSWDHVRRIFSWNNENSSLIHKNENSHKFAYFFMWSFSGDLLPIARIHALDLWATIWQMFVALQVHRIAKTFDFTDSQAKIATFSFFILFGHNLFGFRYYSLAPTSLSYAGYLAILSLLIDRFQIANIFRVPLLASIMAFNHVQELLFLCLLVPSICAGKLYFASSAPNKLRALKILSGTIVLISFSFGFWFKWRFPEHFDNINPASITLISTFKVWHEGYLFRETYGWHGIVALIFAVIFLRRGTNEQRTLGWLTLTPTLALVFPPIVVAMGYSISDASLPYRLLYAFPLSLILVPGIEFCMAHFSFRKPIAKTFAVFAILGLLALPPFKHFRGRLISAVYKVPGEGMATSAIELSQWFAKNRPFPSGCGVITDDMTGYVFDANRGAQMYFRRIHPLAMTSTLKTQEDLDAQEKNFGSICAVVMPRPNLLSRRPYSFLGEYSGHWNPDAQMISARYSAEFIALVDTLNEKGWTEIPATDDYRVFTRPQYR
ncbi:MAG: hypothetical protein ABL958_12880 [Bdellovibrionia bacterium]